LNAITKLILFATVLRFVANCVSLSWDYATLNQTRHLADLTGSTFLVLGSRFQEFGQILLYVGSAVFIEMLARIHSHVQHVRANRSGFGAKTDA